MKCILKTAILASYLIKYDLTYLLCCSLIKLIIFLSIRVKYLFILMAVEFVAGGLSSERIWNQ